MNSLLQDDPNDDIPYGDAPAATSTSKSSSEDLSKLTPDEAARYTEIMEAISAGISLPVSDYNELQTLVNKARG